MGNMRILYVQHRAKELKNQFFFFLIPWFVFMDNIKLVLDHVIYNYYSISYKLHLKWKKMGYLVAFRQER